MIFASEIKALLRHPAVTPRLRRGRGRPVPGVPHRARAAHAVRRDPPRVGGRCGRAHARRRGQRAPWWDLLDAPVDERDDEKYYVEPDRASCTTPRCGGAACRGRSARSARAATTRAPTWCCCRARAPARSTRSPSGSPSSRATSKYNDLYYARQVAEYAKTHAPRVAAVDRRVPQAHPADHRGPGRPGVRAVERVPVSRAAAGQGRRACGW